MPKNRKRSRPAEEQDAFAAAPAELAGGALERFHRLQLRSLNETVRDLEAQRARIAKKDRDRAGERKALTERVRDMQSRFAAKCAQEVEARDGPGAASAAAAESTRSAARSERAAKAAEKRSRDGAGEDELAGAPQAVHDAAEAAAESQRGAARGDRDGPMLVMGDSTGGGVAARGGAAGAEWGGEASAGPEAGASGSSSSLGGAGLAEDRGEVLARS